MLACHNLSVALRTRYRMRDYVTDIQRAVNPSQDAASPILSNHVYRARFLTTLGNNVDNKLESNIDATAAEATQSDGFSTIL
jgi:hypothetical protein